MIKRNDLERIIYYIVLTLIIGLPAIKLLSYILFLNNIVDNTFVINQVYLLWIVIPPLIIIYLIGIFTGKFKFTYADYIIYVLIIFAVLSTIFAIDTNISIFGEEYRYEGLLSIISYYLIFLNVKNISNKKYKNNIISIFLIVGVFQVLYGMLQVYTDFSFIKHFSKSYMAMGLCGNPNFFGSYIIMQLMLAISFYLIERKKRYLLLTIIFFIGLTLAGSTGPFLGFLLSFIFLIICFHKKTNIKTIIKTIILLIITYFIIDYSINYTYHKVFSSDIDRNYNISTEIVDTVINKDKNSDTIGNGRLIVWKNSLPLVKKYWLVGAGLDNFKKVYPYNGISHIYFDKAHNVYLQMAITNGSIVLILYCALCFIIFIKGIRFKNKYYISIYMAFVGYSIQAFANISVIDIAPCFFLILGLLYSKNNEKYEGGDNIYGSLL